MVAGGEMTNVSATTSRRYYLYDKKKKKEKLILKVIWIKRKLFINVLVKY